MSETLLRDIEVTPPQPGRAEKTARLMLGIMNRAFHDTYVGNKGIYLWSGKIKPEHIDGVTDASNGVHVQRLADQIRIGSSRSYPAFNYFLAIGKEGDAHGMAKFRQLGRETIELEEINVMPDDWGRGIGSKLHLVGLTNSLTHCTPQDSEILLKVVDSNERARNWYKNLGYNYTGESEKISLFPDAPKQRRLSMIGNAAIIAQRLDDNIARIMCAQDDKIINPLDS